MANGVVTEVLVISSSAQGQRAPERASPEKENWVQIHGQVLSTPRLQMAGKSAMPSTVKIKGPDNPTCYQLL